MQRDHSARQWEDLAQCVDKGYDVRQVAPVASASCWASAPPSAPSWVSSFKAISFLPLAEQVRRMRTRTLRA